MIISLFLGIKVINLIVNFPLSLKIENPLFYLLSTRSTAKVSKVLVINYNVDIVK